MLARGISSAASHLFSGGSASLLLQASKSGGVLSGLFSRSSSSSSGARAALPKRAPLLVVATRSLSAQAMEAPQPEQQPEPATPPLLQSPPAPSPVDLAAAAPAPSPGVRKTFYKRKLPCPPATEFSSPEGRALFGEALAAGTMTGFFKLVEQYSTQDEPAFCGLASIAMVLNALAIDPRRPWKGSWRWFHEKLLDCCLPLERVAAEGVTLGQAACLAKCNGARVEVRRFGDFSLDDFRAHVADVCASGDEHLVVSYSRRAFSQTGDGHFSPVGGYHAGRDLVLILDTARFKYPPHWVPLPLLFDAMAAPDSVTRQPRGFVRLSARAVPDSVLFTLDIDGGGVERAAVIEEASGEATLGVAPSSSSTWREAEAFVRDGGPAALRALAAAPGATAQRAAAALVAAAPLAAVRAFLAVRFSARQLCSKERCVPHGARQQVLQELRATPLYAAVAAALAGPDGAATAATADELLAERLTMLLLLPGPNGWGAPPETWADAGEGAAWAALCDASAVSIVEAELQYLREQLRNIDRVLDGRLQRASSSSSSLDGLMAECASASCANALDCHTKGDCKPPASAAGAGGAGAGTVATSATAAALEDAPGWDACAPARSKECCGSR